MGLRVFTKEFTFSTRKRLEVVKVTELVEGVVKESGISDGLAVVYVPHSTLAVMVNEYEPRIVEDYLRWIERYVPPNAGWRHDEVDDNAHAHIASAIIGSSRVIPVRNGRLALGTWQEVMVVELDGPRAARKLAVQVIGT